MKIAREMPGCNGYMNPHAKKIKGLSSLIGNTPLLEIEFLYKGRQRKIYAKAEKMNMTGSIELANKMAAGITHNRQQGGQTQDPGCFG